MRSMWSPRRPRARPAGEAGPGISDGGLFGGGTWGHAGGLLASLVLLALVARVAGVLVVGGYHAPWLSEYEEIARTILRNGFYGYNEDGLPPVPSSFMPPLYPFFLAGIMALFSDGSGLHIKAVQSVLSAGSVLLTFWLAWEIFGERSVALLSALISALYPSFIVGALEISTATLEVLLVQVFGILVFRWYRRKSSCHAGLAGLALGLLSLTRAPAMLMAPLASFWMMSAEADQTYRRKIRALALFLAMLAVTIAPWTIRNYLVHGALVPISTNGGINLWIGNNPRATGEFVYFKEVDPDIFARVLPLTEVQRDSLFYEEASSFIRDNPRAFLQLLAKKAVYFWWFRPSIGSSYPDMGLALQAATTGLMLAYTAVLPLAVLGLVLLLRSKERASLPLFGIVVLPYMATSIIFFAATRFRAPVEPFLIILASYAIAGMVRWGRGLSPGIYPHGRPRVFRGSNE